jgi:cysteine desulfurase/selenocysteine lyase
MPGLQAFGASLALLMEIGPDVVSRRILDRAEAVREVARSASWSVFGSGRPQDLSSIVPLERPGIDPDKVAREARTRGVALACRRSRVRISPHIYNNADDLERLRDVLTRPSP